MQEISYRLEDAPAIDLVYTWVDGSDPIWRASRRPYYFGQNWSFRWKDSGELAISLETFRRFAPWIRRIFIVHADCQLPRVTGTDITHIPHSMLLPKSHLPTFNSNSIESYLHRIPDLSEYFIYANDDTFLKAPCHPSYFFTRHQEGNAHEATFKNKVTICSDSSRNISERDAVFRPSLRLLLHTIHSAITSSSSVAQFPASFRNKCEFALWRRSLYNAHQLLEEEFTAVRYPPLHFPRPLRISVCEDAWQRFGATLEVTTQAKFRSSTCVAFLNFLVPFLGIHTDRSELVDLPHRYIYFMDCENFRGAAGMLSRLGLDQL